METDDLWPRQGPVLVSGIARNIKAKSRGSTMTNIRASALVARVSCTLAVAAPRLRISMPVGIVSQKPPTRAQSTQRVALTLPSST